MFSQTTEYALRAVVLLASHPGRPLKTHDISKATKVPVEYLFKVLQSLARAGLVKASRGIYGGYILARPAEQVTLLDVSNAIVPLPRIRHCPLDLPEHRHQLCSLHGRIDAMVEVMEKTLSSTTVADVIAEQANVERPFSLPVANEPPGPKKAHRGGKSTHRRPRRAQPAKLSDSD